MSHLFQALAARVDHWRESRYECDHFPAIREILDFAIEDTTNDQLRYLRRAQLRALETYWYLRLVLNTPKVPALYDALFPSPKDKREALGLTSKVCIEMLADDGHDAVMERIRTDNDFVRKQGLESLRETLSLDYPSYILALAMGAGKTILMGSIIATEFAMAQDYPDGPFVQNALVFAPGKTILGALRELADVPYERILPPRMYKTFAASFKLTFTRDGDKTIPIIHGSSFNVVVTNTEKIRIQKPTGSRVGQARLFAGTRDEEASELANLRLQAIASLPHLAVFSDEAHHTYGQKLLGTWHVDRATGVATFKDDGLKKVRRTIDYLASQTNLIVVVNATGTPYFQRQPLRDVVVWYGLGEGIHDGVLKELANNVKVLDLADDAGNALVSSVISDFFTDYGGVSLPNGAPSRLALYFPSLEVRDELRPAIETALVAKGYGTDLLLAVDNKSNDATRRAFEALARDPAAPHRVLLLVNMGTEGWNCPSLFACALVRKLATSNNFVLQAATRCLRQVPGNTHPARVYLTNANKGTLESQLAETFGTTLRDLGLQHAEREEHEIVLHKPSLPPLLIKRRVLRIRRKAATEAIPLTLQIATGPAPSAPTISTYTLIETQSGDTRFQRLDAGDTHAASYGADVMTAYTAAAALAGNYHLPVAEVLKALRHAYRAAEIPVYHLDALAQQIEAQRGDYESYEEIIEVAVALVKTDGFTRSDVNGTPVYTARVSFAPNRKSLYVTAAQLADASLALDRSFHYEGYNFDSEPEHEFLEWTLALLKDNTHQINGIWFTGGLTDPGKTDLFAEYLGDDGRWHTYTPDFVIQRADGKTLIVEVKADSYSPDITADLAREASGQALQTREGRKAVALKRWQALNPETLRYEVMFANTQLHDAGKPAIKAFLLEAAEAAQP